MTAVSGGMSESRPASKGVLGHLVAYIPSRVVPAALGVAGMALYARILGAERFGELTLILLTGSYASVICSEWIISGFQRFRLIKDDPRLRRAADEAAGWQAVCLLFGTLISLAAGLVLRVPLSVSLAVVAVLWSISLFQLVACRLIMAERSIAYSVLQIAMTVARLGAATIAMVLTQSPAVAATAMSAITLAALGAGARPTLSALWSRLSWASLSALAAFGTPMLATSLALNGLATADRFLLGGISGARATGEYSANYILGEQSTLLLTSILMMVVYPRCVKAWELGRRDRASQLAAWGASSQLELALPFVVLLFAYGNDAMRILFGHGYNEAGLAPVVAIGAVFLGMSQYANLGVQLQRRPMKLASQVILAAIVNVALCLALIPFQGGMGAAEATLASYGALFILAAWANRDFFDVRAFLAESVIHIVGAAAVTVILVRLDAIPKALIFLAYAATVAVVVTRRRLMTSGVTTEGEWLTTPDRPRT